VLGLGFGLGLGSAGEDYAIGAAGLV